MNLTFDSERLTLTPYTSKDVDLSLTIFTDPAVTAFTGGTMSEAEIRSSVSHWTRRGANGCIGVWTVLDRITGEKYGSAALLPIPVEDRETDYSLLIPGKMPPGDIEIGYYLKRAAWGNGYATEASRRLLQFAFEDAGLPEIVATFHKDNAASRHVLEKAGFTDHGTRRCYGSDGVDYRITREEWLQRRRHGGPEFR